MMSFGEVDTLTLTFDKLRYISSGYDQYNESFAQLVALYKDGKIDDKQYRDTILDSVLKYSALEFLALRSIFEIKKSIYGSSTSSVDSFSTMSPSSSPSISSFFVAKDLPSSIKETKSNVTCPKCGTSIKKSAKFCTSCGNIV